MICSICKKEMRLSEGITEMDNQRCHVSCKEQFTKQWRKDKGLDGL